ncbi:MAG TPA: nitrilase-related carbon-nitrogen hydrolase, partial [Candidatus Ozemobacteraceae bacterium]|nr:nitrilase-related carbon-nitrogen hydrolase [Candidatus Ozemobacteraceae bacterium]
AHLAVMPEMWSCSFAGSGLAAEASRLSERLGWIADRAKRGGLWIAAGTLPEPAPDGKAFNTLHLVDPAGNVRLKYRKIHLFPLTGEPMYFAGGEHPAEPLRLGPWTFGAAICFDLRFPELFRAMMKQGVNIFAVPAQFPAVRQDQFALLARARALENQVALLAVNRTGREGGQSFAGGSIAADWSGNISFGLNAESGCGIGELDAAALAMERNKYPFVACAKLL